MTRAILAVLLCASLGASAEGVLPRMAVHPEGHYLMTEDGKPFFWLGDTAWELFHRLNREEAVRYLDNRAKLGFTVVQAVCLAELDGLSVPNAYGHLPFGNPKDPVPAVREGADNDYWDHVDFIVREANRRGIYMVYAPVGRRFKVDLSCIRTPRCLVAWYDPRTGEERDARIIESAGVHEFVPPSEGELLDWVLLVDAEALLLP